MTKAMSLMVAHKWFGASVQDTRVHDAERVEGDEITNKGLRIRGGFDRAQVMFLQSMMKLSLPVAGRLRLSL